MERVARRIGDIRNVAHDAQRRSLFSFAHQKDTEGYYGLDDIHAFRCECPVEEVFRTDVASQWLYAEKADGSSDRAEAQGHGVTIRDNYDEFFDPVFFAEITPDLFCFRRGVCWPKDVVVITIAAVDACGGNERVVFDRMQKISRRFLARNIICRFSHYQDIFVWRIFNVHAAALVDRKNF